MLKSPVHFCQLSKKTFYLSMIKLSFFFTKVPQKFTVPFMTEYNKCFRVPTQYAPGVLSDLGLQHLVEAGRGLAGKGLGEALFRHQPVLGDQVHSHVPLSAV